MIVRIVLLTLLIPALAFADWERLAPLPSPNGGFACGFVDGKLLVAGGTNWRDGTKQWLDVIWRYDPETKGWSSPGKLPRPCAYAASGVINNRLIIAGGSDGTTVSDDVLSLATDGQCQKPGKLPEGSVYSCSAVLNDQLHIAGGATEPARLETFTTSHFRLAFDRFNLPIVTRGEPLGKAGFGIGTAAAASKRVFIFGGAQYNAATQVTNLDQVQVLGAEGPIVKLPQAIRGLTAVPLSEPYIYLAGGYPNDSDGFVDTGWIFQATLGRFVPATSLPIKAMVHLVSDGEWIYCLGGEDRKQHRSDQMWRIRIRELLAPVILQR